MPTPTLTFTPKPALTATPTPVASHLPGAAVLAVLDTNVVLDLWLFDDPRAGPLRHALQTGRVRALATSAMLAELAAVLQRPFAQAWPTPAAETLLTLQACCHLVEPAAWLRPPAPRCSDADDQKFIDLALAHAVPWLISRDRAVLKLARPARGRGLQIVTPEAWAGAQ